MKEGERKKVQELQAEKTLGGQGSYLDADDRSLMKCVGR